MSATKTQKDKKKKPSPSGGVKNKSTTNEAKKKIALKSSEPELKETSLSTEKHEILTETSKNIEAGGEAGGEKISKISEKTAETIGEVYDTVKKKLSTAFSTGTKVVEEITQTTQKYIEKYQHNMEVKKLSAERDRLTAELGLKTFVKYKMNETALKKLLGEKEILDLIKEIETLDREIVKIGRQLANSK